MVISKMEADMKQGLGEDCCRDEDKMAMYICLTEGLCNFCFTVLHWLFRIWNKFFPKGFLHDTNYYILVTS